MGKQSREVQSLYCSTCAACLMLLTVCSHTRSLHRLTTKLPPHCRVQYMNRTTPYAEPQGSTYLAPELRPRGKTAGALRIRTIRCCLLVRAMARRGGDPLRREEASWSRRHLLYPVEGMGWDGGATPDLRRPGLLLRCGDGESRRRRPSVVCSAVFEPRERGFLVERQKQDGGRGLRISVRIRMRGRGEGEYLHFQRLGGKKLTGPDSLCVARAAVAS